MPGVEIDLLRAGGDRPRRSPGRSTTGCVRGDRAGDGREVAEADLERDRAPATSAWARSRPATASAMAHEHRLQLVALGAVLRERLLVADRLSGPVGLDRADRRCRRRERGGGGRAPCRAAATSDGQRQRGQLADRGHAEALRAAPAWPARRPTAPRPGAGGGTPAPRPAPPRRRPGPASDTGRPWPSAWPPPRPAWRASLLGATPTRAGQAAARRRCAGRMRAGDRLGRRRTAAARRSRRGRPRRGRWARRAG